MRDNDRNKISLSDVERILQGWFDNDKKLACGAVISGASFQMKGRIQFFQSGDSIVNFLSDDQNSRFSFVIQPDFHFSCSDSRSAKKGLFITIPETRALLSKGEDLISLTELPF